MMSRFFRITILLHCLFASFGVQAQEALFAFDFSGEKQRGAIAVSPAVVYGQHSGYGYDLATQPGDGQPFFFSVDVPEGNYLVTVVLGDPEKPACTTVKSESRRLMLEHIPTAKGEYVTRSFVVNIRNTKIGETDSVRIKKREIGKLIWDNKLTLEFNGQNPSVVRIEIRPVNDLLTLFLLGDSTVVDEGEEPWCGWGQLLPRFFKPKIAIANYAESGEAANTFVSSKRFAKVLTKLKKGDYVFIQFGHNDQKQKGEGKGPFTSYKANLRYLTDEVRARGGIPVLITSMHRRSFDPATGKIINTHGDYPAAVQELAREEQIPLIDLNEMSRTLYEAWGEEGSKKAFVHYPAGTFPGQTDALADNTHFNSSGAYQIARCVLRGIVENKLPLQQYFTDDFTLFDPAHPDAIDSVQIPLTPFSSTLKPDGN